MAKLFSINLIFYFSVIVNYTAGLIPICKDDIFSYSGVEVNAIFKLKYIREYKIQNFLIDTNIDYNDYLSWEGAKRMEDYRDLFNKQFLNIFNDSFINNPKEFSTINSLNYINDLNKVVELHKWCKEELKDKFYNNTVLKMKNRSYFLVALQSLYSNKFDPNDKFERVKYLENRLLSFDLKNGINSAIQHDTLAYIIKNHEILTLDRFDLNRFSKIFFDLRSTGTLRMNIFLPLNDVNITQNLYNCISAAYLPKFYRKKINNYRSQFSRINSRSDSRKKLTNKLLNFLVKQLDIDQTDRKAKEIALQTGITKVLGTFIGDVAGAVLEDFLHKRGDKVADHIRNRIGDIATLLINKSNLVLEMTFRNLSKLLIKRKIIY